ncbi:elongation factor G-like protein EF-G2 [Streptomyces sp. NPDC002067]
MNEKPGADPGAAAGPAAVRNVVLAGPSGAGKTTLVEALAVAAGATGRAGRVEDGDTLSDQDPIEQRHQRSVQLSLVPLEWRGCRINLLDTPGYADFVGELRAGLRAADAALFTVSAAEDVTGAVRALWAECAAVGMPRALVLTHLDAARADVATVLRGCGTALGDGDPDAVLPLYLPLYGAAGADGRAPVTGLLDLLTRRVAEYGPDGRAEREPAGAEPALLDEARGRLIEGIIAESEDETLMDRYLGGAELDLASLVADLETAVARGTFHPALIAAPATAAARQGLGTVELLDLIVRGFPAPGERPAPEVTTPDGAPHPAPPCDPSAPLAAEVVRTTSDPYVGRLSLVRVFSGTLRPDEPVHVSGHGLTDRGHADHDVQERVGALSVPSGKQQRPLPQAVAGELAYVAKLGRAETGDTLSSCREPLLMAPWTMPDPQLPVAIEAHGKADEDKLSHGLARLVAEDPTMRLEQHPHTGQVVLWCMGEAHAEVALERLRTRYGVRVDTVAYRVPLRETFGAAASGRGRQVKQSGGHGQFAICEIDVEPLPAGSGVEFTDTVVGGAVPRQFIASVEKGVRAQAAQGVAAGYPLVDIRVTLRDGKAHTVDSSDAAFQAAGALALRDAAGQVRIELLEPVAEVAVLIPDEFVGAVMSDLSGRRGRVVGTEQEETGDRTWVRAEVPEAEIARYAVDLRSLTHGTGRFTRTPLRHEPMPPHLAAAVRGGRENGA